MLEYPVGTAQVLAEKFSLNMITFVKRHVVSDLSIDPRLNWRDIFVLSQIMHYSKGLTAADISSNTRLDPATVLRANEKLKQNNYITIVEQAFDARSNLIQLTSDGAALLQQLFLTYLEKQDHVFDRFLPRLDVEDIRELFIISLDVQDHAEKFASFLPSGKIRRVDRTSFSRVVFQNSFEGFTRFPEFILQVYCRRISSDYMAFLKSHAMSNMTDKALRKSRELLTLMSLNYLESPVTSMDVARLLRFDPATTTRAIAILTEKGFVIPLPNRHMDDRKKPLILTEKGRIGVAEYKDLMSTKTELASDRLDIVRSQAELKNQLGVLSFLAARSEILATIKPGSLS